MTDLFAGPGGMTLGARTAGAPGIGIEWDANAVATRRANGLPTIHADVRRHGPADFPDRRLLAGGPPCQTFTMAGTGSGRVELATLVAAVHGMATGHPVPAFADDRTGLVLEPLRWILEAERLDRPYEAVVLEQVPAVLPVWTAYATVLERLGYGVATGILRTEQYGIPQTRRRAVLVARYAADAHLPAPTHRPYRKGVPQHEGDPALLPWVAMGDVIRGGWPFEVISNYGTGGDPKNRGRRTSREPAFTVTGKISRLRLVDPTGRELPRLTHSEAGILQGMPADWQWAGGDVAQQIGNLCPPPLAHALVAAALSQHALTTA
jgi:DNA (cytosine-5)-methyltransferase 1